MYHPLSPNLDLGSFLLVRGKKDIYRRELIAAS